MKQFIDVSLALFVPIIFTVDSLITIYNLQCTKLEFFLLFHRQYATIRNIK